jgi:hypothetical protein
LGVEVRPKRAAQRNDAALEIHSQIIRGARHGTRLSMPISTVELSDDAVSIDDEGAVVEETESRQPFNDQPSTIGRGASKLGR